ncbi:MAG: bifunctional UDP-N-acetylglucosamine diphosphorylase/glucosamine-1-phosphate N-acetyltransferase GlmU [Myxococcota bacterium]
METQGEATGTDPTTPLAVVILAAGQGTRMKSRRSKVLHEIAGQPMLAYPLATAEALGAERLIVVIGRDADEVRKRFAGRAEFALQADQRGTGHAVLQAAPKLRDFRGELLVLYGDTPLLRLESLQRMRELKRASGAGLVLLSARVPLPGRVVRDARGQVERIVETTDATPEELEIEEGNTGVYLLDSELLWEALDQVDDDNEQGEIYLTDAVGYAVARGRGVEAMVLEEAEESLGVNNRAELAEAAAVVRRRTAERWLADGVTLVDPANTYIDVEAVLGRDTVVEPGCQISGPSRIGESVHLRAGCVIESSRVGVGADVGPHVYLEPGSEVAPGERVATWPRPDPPPARAARVWAAKKRAAKKKKTAKKKTARKAAKKKTAKKVAGESAGKAGKTGKTGRKSTREAAPRQAAASKKPAPKKTSGRKSARRPRR